MAVDVVPDRQVDEDDDDELTREAALSLRTRPRQHAIPSPPDYDLAPVPVARRQGDEMDLLDVLAAADGREREPPPEYADGDDDELPEVTDAQPRYMEEEEPSGSGGGSSTQVPSSLLYPPGSKQRKDDDDWGGGGSSAVYKMPPANQQAASQYDEWMRF